MGEIDRASPTVEVAVLVVLVDVTVTAWVAAATVVVVVVVDGNALVRPLGVAVFVVYVVVVVVVDPPLVEERSPPPLPLPPSPPDDEYPSYCHKRSKACLDGSAKSAIPLMDTKTDWGGIPAHQASDPGVTFLTYKPRANRDKESPKEESSASADV